MLGIGGQNAGAGFRGALHEEIACADKAFLVGQRHGGATIDRRKRGLQSGGAAHGCHHPVRRTGRSLDDRALAGAAFGAGAGQLLFQLRQPARVGDRDKARIELACKLRQCLHIAVRGQRLDAVAIARGPQQIHGAVADRAGGPQHGHGAHRTCSGLVVTQRNSAHVLTKP